MMQCIKEDVAVTVQLVGLPATSSCISLCKAAVCSGIHGKGYAVTPSQQRLHSMPNLLVCREKKEHGTVCGCQTCKAICNFNKSDLLMWRCQSSK